jgi:peptidoglycan/xylan/chitin deacetylase (PgdA/CDA1 family)
MPIDAPDAAPPVGGRRVDPAPVLLRQGDWHVFATPRSRNTGGEAVAEFKRVDGTTFPVLSQNGSIEAPFELDEAYANYVSERWVSGSSTRRLSPRQLAAFYRVKRVIPRGVQVRARRALMRWQGQPTFPRWPLDEGVARLLGMYAASLPAQNGRQELAFRWFWPSGSRAAFILSHDVESREGVRLAVELADLEEALGFRSAFNFGGWYEVDPGVLRELGSRGFEIGLHGIAHDRSLFSSRQEFDRQLPLLRSLAERFGASGFRSPATHRVFDWLAELPVEYDGTVPHSDPYEPQPGGCCSIWPFFVGDVVELPYTLPQDHTLLTLLGHRTPKLWLDTAAAIEARSGLVHCVSHPDPGYLGDADKRHIYAEFLQGMRDHDGVWHALPVEVARWWRRRDLGADERLTTGRVAREDPPTDLRFVAPPGGSD